jgi:hypothetical protein
MGLYEPRTVTDVEGKPVGLAIVPVIDASPLKNE